jgi:glycosyltransferase involved in cell wall biosynthesis
MRILQVMAGGRHGGAETACVDMCIALKEAGQDIEAVIRPHPERVARLQQAGIKVHTLPFGGPIELYTAYQLKKIIREFKPDIVQTWMSRAAQKVTRWRRGSGIPPYVTLARLGGYYKVSHFKSIDCFVTITPDIKRHLVDHGIDESLVRHINNFADVEEADAPASRAALDTPDDATLLLGLGRLHTAKAFDSLIKAVAGMDEVYLWIAGEGPERENLEALIKELNVGARVKLLGWRDDRAALLQACDICFFSSRYEPFGTVFVQAWAQKAALITTNADGPRQFVRDGQDGLVVKIDDVPGFRAAIQRLGDKNLANSLIEKAYQRYLAEFTKERCVGQYLAFYQEAIARKTARDAA